MTLEDRVARVFLACAIAVSAGWWGSAVGPAFAQSRTPAQERIAAAEAMLRSSQGGYDAYNELALAYTRRARETSDTSFYDRAEEAIQSSLRLSPRNFEAQKLRAWVLLGRHEFAAALELATALNKQAPDDLLVYGLLTDAHVELGHYKEAEEACQWMLDLRPGNIPALTRAAYLRELFGDLEGAGELIGAAYERTVPTEVEDQAWLLTQAAHLQLQAGRADRAEPLLQRALSLFGGYHYALAQLANVRTAQGRHADAVELLRQRYVAAPHPENLHALAEALARAGRRDEARRAFAEFEAAARRESAGWDNANRELVFYYADRARKPVEALRIASAELARRQDVYTREAYAWALHKSRRTRQARAEMARVLAVGIKDPEVLARAAAMGFRPREPRP